MEELTSRQQQALDTKWHIFRVAMDIFSQKRFDEVKISDICKAAGVSTGAFYHHYKTKEHLLLEEYNLVDKLLWSSTDALLATDEIERLTEYTVMYAQSAEDAGLEIVTEVYRMYLTLRISFPMDFNSGVLSSMRRLVEEAQASRKLEPGLDSKVVALDLLILARGVIYNWCHLRGSFALADKVLRMAKPYILSLCTADYRKKYYASPLE